MKGALDSAGAAFLLTVLLPALLVIAGAILLQMGRPVLFRQIRIGRHGKQFEILKFRTMTKEMGAGLELGANTRVDCEASRTSSIGRFLRATSLDELPQLINVLRGDMSFVGPRPVWPIPTEQTIAQIPDYHLRHRVKSGITGWAQIQGAGRGPDSGSIHELFYRVELDNHYIDHWSFWLDLKIILLTLPAVHRFPQRRVPSFGAAQRRV